MNTTRICLCLRLFEVHCELIHNEAIILIRTCAHINLSVLADLTHTTGTSQNHILANIQGFI